MERVERRDPDLRGQGLTLPVTSTASSSEERARPQPIKAVPVRHPGRWLAVAVLAVLAAMLVNTILTNPGFRWPVVGEYLFSPPVLNGLRNTLILTVLSMAIGVVGGIALAVMRLSPNPVLVGSGGALHLALPRHTADRAVAVLELPRRALPAAVARGARSGRSSSRSTPTR